MAAKPSPAPTAPKVEEKKNTSAPASASAPALAPASTPTPAASVATDDAGCKQADKSAPNPKALVRHIDDKLILH